MERSEEGTVGLEEGIPSERMIFSAKRLAATLAQIVRRYEQQFGPVELNAAKRRAGQPT